MKINDVDSLEKSFLARTAVGWGTAPPRPDGVLPWIAQARQDRRWLQRHSATIPQQRRRRGKRKRLMHSQR